MGWTVNLNDDSRKATFPKGQDEGARSGRLDCFYGVVHQEHRQARPVCQLFQRPSYTRNSRSYLRLDY